MINQSALNRSTIASLNSSVPAPVILRAVSMSIRCVPWSPVAST